MGASREVLRVVLPRVLAFALMAGAGGLVPLETGRLVATAAAADWGAIEPGVSTPATVRERWGAPSKETRLKVEGYDTLQWVFEGNRAPSGLMRMTVDFGLLTPAGYKPDVVRLLTLEPNKGMFGQTTVEQGWGAPDATAGTPQKDLSYFYREGLLVFFDKEDFATRMVFSIAQPDPRAQPRSGTRPPGTQPQTGTPPAGGAPPPAAAPSGAPLPASGGSAPQPPATGSQPPRR
jgi:hypothetical protein